MACSFNNSTPTTTMTRMEDEPQPDRLHNNHHHNNKMNNHDIAATKRDKPDEMSTHSTDNTNNIAEDGIVTTHHGRERSGNTPQPKPSPTTPNQTAPTHTKHHIQTTTCPTKAGYTPHKKHGVIFEAIVGLTIEP
jgi:hypothetical protein